MGQTRAKRKKQTRDKKQQTMLPASNLPPHQENSLELKALAANWIMTESFVNSEGKMVDPQALRKALMAKVMSFGVQGTGDQALKVLRTIAAIEQRATELQIKQRGDLPDQINIQNNTVNEAPADPKQVAAEILKSKAVQQALDDL